VIGEPRRHCRCLFPDGLIRAAKVVARHVHETASFMFASVLLCAFVNRVNLRRCILTLRFVRSTGEVEMRLKSGLPILTCRTAPITSPPSGQAVELSCSVSLLIGRPAPPRWVEEYHRPRWVSRNLHKQKKGEPQLSLAIESADTTGDRAARFVPAPRSSRPQALPASRSTQ